jgi:uncharacterized OsmC-like protein
MSKHIFQLRMSASYGSSENDIASLDVQMLNENEWEALDLNTKTPGFLIYVYSIFTCQHMFLRTNGSERNMAFASSQGEILVETSEEWIMEKVDVRFDVKLVAGEASTDNIDYIISRMKLCPVSKNLPQAIESLTSVEFHDG